jgi:phosphate transport system substrate-binding protein
MNLRSLLPAVATVAILSAGCAPSDSVTIQGCGATFPAPLYKRWFLEFYKMHPDLRVNYQPIGSGAGIRQLEEGLVDFAGTDEPKSEKDLLKIAKTLTEREHREVELIQFPMTAGSDALCYNIPGLSRDRPLNLTRKAYMGIVLGDIGEWDDPAIQSANEASLPHIPITFVHRADSSGTTFVFTNHLSAVDERWKKGDGLGATKKVSQWPTKNRAFGGKGNSGVAAYIEQIPGAFGYVEAGYAELVDLPIAAVENKQGKFVMPTAEASLLGLADAKFDKVLGASVPDPAGPVAYPIVTYTWIVCRRHYDDPRIAASLKAVFEYCLESNAPGRGQELSSELGYVAMPTLALEKSRERLKEIEAPEVADR